MKRKNRRTARAGVTTSRTEVTAEVRAILDASRSMTANGTEPRKHHLVPKFYLDRWAEGDRVKVTDLDSEGKTYVVAPSKALVANDYYRLPADAVEDGSPVTWEVWLSKVEDKAAAAFRAIDSNGLENLDRTTLSDLLFFLGVQMTRARAFRFKGRWMSGPGQYWLFELNRPGAIEALLTRAGEETTAERVAEVTAYFEKVLADPWSVRLDAGLEMDMSMRAGRGLAETLATRRIVLFETPRAIMTCDEPIVELYERMDASPPMLQGGIHGAPIIVFPFGPNQVLAMFRSNMPLPRRARISVAETIELNRAIAGNAHRYLVERPGERLGSELFIPEAKRDPISIESAGDFVWTKVQRRWHGHSNAPHRPVQSWWPTMVPPAPQPPRSREEWERERTEYYR